MIRQCHTCAQERISTDENTFACQHPSRPPPADACPAVRHAALFRTFRLRPGASRTDPTASGEPAAYVEEDVTIGTGDWAVGKLCPAGRAAGGTALPLVLLVSGNGPNDMDETLYSNKPFRDIAQGLAAQGVASLPPQQGSPRRIPSFSRSLPTP